MFTVTTYRSLKPLHPSANYSVYQQPFTVMFLCLAISSLDQYKRVFIAWKSKPVIAIFTSLLNDCDC